jgi:hypothetical protein
MAIGLNPLSIIYNCLSSFLTMKITHPLSPSGTAHYCPATVTRTTFARPPVAIRVMDPIRVLGPTFGTIARQPSPNVLDRKPHILLYLSKISTIFFEMTAVFPLTMSEDRHLF